MTCVAGASRGMGDFAQRSCPAALQRRRRSFESHGFLIACDRVGLTPRPATRDAGAMAIAHPKASARTRLGLLVGLACIFVAPEARAVQPVFDPAGTSFFDVPFPYESRRDADGTVSIAGFPFPATDLVQQYAAAIEQS